MYVIKIYVINEKYFILMHTKKKERFHCLHITLSNFKEVLSLKKNIKIWIVNKNYYQWRMN